MRSFESIEKLLTFDFQAMRGLGNRATDEALLFFHECLDTFFKQFKTNRPTQAEFEQYVTLMEQIIDKMNVAEGQYYKDRYQKSDGHENVEDMLIQSLQRLPIRLQFWAAAEKFGDPIRFAKQHRETVNEINNFRPAQKMKGCKRKLNYDD